MHTYYFQVYTLNSPKWSSMLRSNICPFLPVFMHPIMICTNRLNFIPLLYKMLKITLKNCYFLAIFPGKHPTHANLKTLYKSNFDFSFKRWSHSPEVIIVVGEDETTLNSSRISRMCLLHTFPGKGLLLIELCPHPKFICWNPSFKCDCIWNGSFKEVIKVQRHHKGRPRSVRAGVRTRRGGMPKISVSLSSRRQRKGCVRNSKEVVVYRPRRDTSPEPTLLESWSRTSSL